MYQTHFIWTAPTNETLAAGKFGQIEENLNICTKGEKSEKPDGIRKTQGCFGQSLNTALAIELVTLAIELVTLDLLVARAIAVKALSLAAPQHLADRSLIRILGNLYGTIVETWL